MSHALSPNRHRRPVLAFAVLALLLSLGAAAEVAQPDTLFARAGRALGSGDVDVAEGLYKAMLDIDGGDHRALNGMATIGLVRGDADFAIDYARKAVKRDRRNSDYHLTLAYGYGTRIMQGGFSSMFYVGKFKKECETAVDLDPSNIDAHMGLLQYYAMAPGLMGGSPEKAAETAGTISGLDEFMGHIADAFLAETAEDAAGTEVAYVAAAKVDTTNPDGWGALGMYYMRSEQYEKAVPVGKRIFRLAPDAWESPYQLGKAYLMLGEDLDEAEQWFRIAIDLIAAEKRPDEHRLASAHWRIGMIEERRGDLEAARSSWETALTIEAEHEEARAAIDSLILVLPEGR